MRGMCKHTQLYVLINSNADSNNNNNNNDNVNDNDDDNDNDHNNNGRYSSISNCCGISNNNKSSE